MDITVTVAEFINRAQTKIRELTAKITDQYSEDSYQSDEVELMLMQRSELQDYIKMLNQTSYGGLTNKEVRDYIDMFYNWLDMKTIAIVTYSSYVAALDTNVIVPSTTFASQVDHDAEVAARAAADSSLDNRLDALEAIDHDNLLPAGFDDNKVASEAVVYDDDTALHTHANKSTLDDYSQSEADLADAVAKKHANNNDPTAGQKAALAGTSGTPAVGNKYVTDDDARNSNSRAPTAHNHPISEVTNLQAQIDQFVIDIAAMAGSDGRDPVFRILNGVLEYKYTGEPDGSYQAIGNVIGAQGQKGDSFKIEDRGDAADRLDAKYSILSFNSGDVDAGTDQINYASHNLDEGRRVRLTNDQAVKDLPAPLAVNTDYFVKVVDANNIQLEGSPGGGAIDLTDGGTGAHTVGVAEGYTYLAEDSGDLYLRNASVADGTQVSAWSSPLKFLGDPGWSPVIAAFVVSSAKVVHEIIDWVGGQGVKPSFDPGSNPPNPIRWFIGPGGPTLDTNIAVNVKGNPGDEGPPGNSDNPFANTVWIAPSPVGDDVTGKIGDITLPFATPEAAHAAVIGTVRNVEITAITKADPAVITVPDASAFPDGMDIYMEGIEGMVQIADGMYKVANPTSTTIELHDSSDTPIDSSAYSTYTAGGSVASDNGLHKMKQGLMVITPGYYLTTAPLDIVDYLTIQTLPGAFIENATSTSMIGKFGVPSAGSEDRVLHKFNILGHGTWLHNVSGTKWMFYIDGTWSGNEDWTKADIIFEVESAKAPGSRIFLIEQVNSFKFITHKKSEADHYFGWARDGLNKLIVEGDIEGNSASSSAFITADCSEFEMIKGSIKNNYIGSSGAVEVKSGVANVRANFITVGPGIKVTAGTLRYGGRTEVTGANTDAIQKNGGTLIVEGGSTLIATGTGKAIDAASGQDVILAGDVVSNKEKGSNVTIKAGRLITDSNIV